MDKANAHLRHLPRPRGDASLAVVGYNGVVLTKIRLKNFKLHENTFIKASRITVFIGPNNSGKSSVFQALLALRHAASQRPNTFLLHPSQRQDTNADQPYLCWSPPHLGGPLDLGEFENVVRHNSRELEIGLDAELPATNPLNKDLRKDAPIQVSLDVRVRDNRLIHHKGHLSCAFGDADWRWCSEERPAPDAQMAINSVVGLGFKMTEDFNLLTRGGISGMGGTTEEITNRALAAEERGGALTGKELFSLQQRLAEAPARAIESLRYVPPLRGFEEMAYPTTRFPRAETLDRLVLPDRAVALTNLLAANAKLRTQLSEQLKALLHIGIEFETAPSHRVRVWATSASSGTPETLFVNEGSGAGQLPFILVPLALAAAGDTVLLSEPEAHLHPKGQSDLTGMMLRLFKFTQGQLQFFIETHSEHVLHSILQAVAKGELSQNDLTIYYFEEPVDRVARARPLAINERGQVDGGLPGFFEQSLAELTSYLDALKKT